MAAITLLITMLATQPGAGRARAFRLDSISGLSVPYGGKLSSATYRGRKAVVFTEDLDPNFGDVAVLPGIDFKDGTIDFDVAGRLTPSAGPGSRSFCGIAFRGSGDMTHFENFYLRMTNGRSQDQELRNHSVQYCSVPDYTWDVLRQKRPSRYEAYTDLVLGEWTHVKVVVRGTEATFYVNNAKQPTLLVHGLLGKERSGKVALWVAAHTQAYFANVVIKPA